MRRCERGSISVEFAAVLPLVAIAMLLVAQVGVLIGEQLAVQHAAREGARDAAVTNDDASARQTALAAGDLDADRAEITIGPSEREVGTPVIVEIAYRPTIMPLLDAFMPGDIVLHARVAMRTERASS